MSQAPAAVLFVLIWLGCGFPLAAQNFVSSDPAVTHAAEAARERSAIFWTGRPLPANWSTPCPIRICFNNGPAQGASRFSFTRGEVFGWQMEVLGTRQEILQNIIPHEVDHLVRATLVRRPIIRWLDEGCACLSEAEAVRQQLRQQARDLDLRKVSLAWLTALSYPLNNRQQAELYIAGFVFVEYLLQLDSPGKLLELQRHSDRFSAAFEELYGFPLEALPARCHERITSREQTSPAPPTALPPLANAQAKLTIWTADWCGPCQLFKRDWRLFPEFRAKLERRYEIEIVDFDSHPKRALAEGIAKLPAFARGSDVLYGYTTPADLLSRLQSALPYSVPDQAVATDQQTPAAPAPPSQATESVQPLVNPTPPQPVIPDRNTPLPRPDPQPEPLPPVRPRRSSWLGTAVELLPASLSLLQWGGLLGGSALTGGAGAILLPLAIRLLTRKRKVSQTPKGALTGEEAPATGTIPFPRHLDEARQLLQLRQTEGRVAILDALRGMFLDDELEKLSQSGQEAQRLFARELQQAIDARIDEVAPLTTRPAQ
jgi:hypothetical protein